VGNTFVIKTLYLRKAFVIMNRLVIIGNGFDLAHGLPTKYSDFIDDYWKSVCDTNGTKAIINDKDEFVTIICKFGYTYNSSEYSAIDNLKSYDELKNFIERNQNKSGDFIMEFKNLFFKKISEYSIENWVDIENEYYKELKKIVKSTSLAIESKKQKTIVLNQEFAQVRNLLEKYLKEKIEEKYDFTLYRNNSINNVLLPELSNPFDEKQYLKEFQQSDQLYVKEFLNKSTEGYNLITHFLSFNYTKVVEQYFVGFAFPKNINYIHGKLNDSINTVNFGFGDEMDDDYKLIENIDDNEYLKNFKSFQYLQNSNYKSLLDFVESDRKFQVYIMGHSCGLSDRTMLNTIFEHPNCISIKVFYHKREDETDNYTEIIQNISRHFNKKKLMREKIVNKTLCQPLPQIQLPLK
jgi:hypothetical protein